MASVTFVLLIAWCGAGRAQEDVDHTIQAGLGVSYERSNRLSDQNAFGGLVMTGSVAQNRRLRWAIDFGIEFAGSPFQAVPPSGLPADAMAKIDQLLMQFHSGPEVTKHSSRSSLFAHVLPGYTSWSLGALAGESWASSIREGGFSLAVGGGMDVHVRNDVNIRMQVDYMPAWHGKSDSGDRFIPSVPPGKSPNANVRIALILLGVVNRPRP